MFWIIGLLGATIGITTLIAVGLANAARGRDYGESVY